MSSSVMWTGRPRVASSARVWSIVSKVIATVRGPCDAVGSQGPLGPRGVLDAPARTAIQLTHRITLEIEGERRPVCLAEWITLAIYE